MWAVDNVLGLVLFVVPKHTDRVSPVHDELISAAARGVGHEGAEVLLFLERLDGGGSVLLIDATLTAIAVDVGQLVDAQSVLLVERGVVELAHGCGGLGGR